MKKNELQSLKFPEGLSTALDPLVKGYFFDVKSFDIKADPFKESSYLLRIEFNSGKVHTFLKTAKELREHALSGIVYVLQCEDDQGNFIENER